MKENYAIKDIAENVRSINQRIDHNHQDSIVHAIKPDFNESIKSTKREPESAPPTVGARKIESHNISNCIRIQGIQEDVNLSKNENDIKTNTEVGNLLKELGVNAKIVHLGRLGSFEKINEKSESKSFNIESHATSEKVAPRVVMVEIKNNWEVRLILAQAGTAWDTLAKRNIYIRKALTREQIAKENACLKKRRELNAQGDTRRKLKIKNFQLFNGDDLVALIENTNWQSTTSCTLINARSLLHLDRRTLFSNAAISTKRHVIAITVSFLSSDVTDAQLFLREYNTNRSDRKSGNKSNHGGLLLAVRKELNSVELIFPLVWFLYPCSVVCWHIWLFYVCFL